MAARKLKVSTTGYKENSKDKNLKELYVPSPNLTMTNVNRRVKATPVYENGSYGVPITMMPGVPNYSFPGAVGVIEKKLRKAQLVGEVPPEYETVNVTDPNDPAYQEYLYLQNLYNWSNVQDYDRRHELAFPGYYGVKDGDYTLFPASKYSNTYDNWTNLPYNDLTLDGRFNDNRPRFENYNTDETGYYGSKANRYAFNTKAELDNFIATNRGLNPSMYGNRGIADHSAAMQQIIDKYTPIGYDAMVDFNNPQIGYDYRYNGPPNKQIFIRPITPVLEDEIDRDALRKIYPGYSDEEIDEVVAINRLTPSYVTNTYGDDGENQEISFDNTNEDPNYVHPNVVKQQPYNVYDDNGDIAGKTNASPYDWSPRAGVTGYLPESISEYNQTQRANYLPRFGTPESYLGKKYVYNEPEKVQESNENYTLHYSGNPGVAYVHYKKDNGDGTFTEKNLGATQVKDWLDDEQQKQFHSPSGGTARVNYNPNAKMYTDVKDAIDQVEDFREQEKKLQKRRKNEASQSLKFQKGGDISIPDLRKVTINALPKAQTMGEFNTSYDPSKSAAENLELNRRAQAAGWNSVDEYEKAGWGYKGYVKVPDVVRQQRIDKGIPADQIPEYEKVEEKKPVKNSSELQGILDKGQEATKKSEWEQLGYENKFYNYKNDPDFFDSHARLDDNPRSNQWIRDRVYSGEWGYNPVTKETRKVSASNKADVSPETKTLAKDVRTWTKEEKLAHPNSTIKNLPKAEVEQLRKEDASFDQYVTNLEKEAGKRTAAAQSKAMVNNPAFYAPGVIAGLAVAPELLGAELFGTGVTAGNILNPMFIGHGIKNTLDSDSDMRKSWSKAYDNPTGANLFDATLETGLNSLNFLGARALPGDIKAFGKGYQNIATGNSMIPYAWRSPAVGLSQEASAEMFNSLLNSGKMTPVERNIVLEYQHDSAPFTGRFGNHTIDVAKRDALNNIINKYQLQFPQNSNAIATRRFAFDKAGESTLGADVEGSRMNFGDRPTSFTVGVGKPGYNGAPDRLVIPSRYLPRMKNNFITNEYTAIPKEHLELIGQPSTTGRQTLIDFGSKVGNNKALAEERELLGTGLDFKQIGKVKNDIGGFDVIVKPRNVKAGTSASTGKTAEAGETLSAADETVDWGAKRGTDFVKTEHEDLANTIDELRADRIKFWETPKGKARLEAVIENTPELKAGGLTVDDYIAGMRSMTNENRTAANQLAKASEILATQEKLINDFENIRILEQDTGMAYANAMTEAELDTELAKLQTQLDDLKINFDELQVNSDKVDNAFMNKKGVIDLNKVEDPAKLPNPYTKFTTGVGPYFTISDAKRVIDHELGHFIQRGVQTNLDKELKNLELLDSEARNLFNSVKGSSTDTQAYDAIFNKTNEYFKKARKYFRTGSDGQEKLPFLEEVRADMLQKGIIKDLGDDITEGMIRQHYANYMMEAQGGKYPLRLYDIMKNNPNNFKLLQSVMSKMPAVLIGTGVGIQMMGGDEEGQVLPQKKRGGRIKHVDFIASRNNRIANSLPKAQTMGEVPYEIAAEPYRDPKISRDSYDREYYDPMTETIHMKPSYPNVIHEAMVKDHESEHHDQKLKGRMSSTEYWPGPLKEPVIGASADMIYPYYNRATQDVYNLMGAAPQSTLFGIPEDVAVMGFQDKTYDTPGTAEYEAEHVSREPRTLYMGDPVVENAIDKTLGRQRQDPEMMFKDKYNTELTKEEQKDFDKWVAKESKQQGRDIMMDKGAYDIQGFWKSGDWKKRDADNHGTDTWKKPNHPTFSNESKYHGADGWYGGNWEEDAGYQPSKQTFNTYGPDYYNWMFGNEPNRPEHLDMSRYISGENYGFPITYEQGGDVRRVKIKSLPKNWKNQ